MSQIIENSTIIPSLVGVGKTDFGLLSAGNLKRTARELPHVVQWNGTQCLVDHHVEQYTRPTERMDFLRLADGPEARPAIRHPCQPGDRRSAFDCQY